MNNTEPTTNQETITLTDDEGVTYILQREHIQDVCLGFESLPDDCGASRRNLVVHLRNGTRISIWRFPGKNPEELHTLVKTILDFMEGWNV